MSFIPIPFQDLKMYEEHWLKNRTIDLKNEKLVRMKIIIASKKCSVDEEENCREYKKGERYSSRLCRVVEPIKFI